MKTPSQYFQKIYFIALYEKEATLIMSELLSKEFTEWIDSSETGTKSLNSNY